MLTTKLVAFSKNMNLNTVLYILRVHAASPLFIFCFSEVKEHTKPVNMVYIRQRQLAKLHEYKYAGVDHSLLSKYVLKPFYTNVAIKCFPMSMA